jgi:diguanylate cyclase (GGDEF)-like protein
MTNVLIGVSVGLGALVLFLLIFLLTRLRRDASGAGRGLEDVAGLQARIEELERELAAAGGRPADVGHLVGSIDLEEVLSRTAEAAAAVAGADAALVLVHAPGEAEPIVASAGLSGDEANRLTAAGPPARTDSDGGQADPLRYSLAVPLAAEAEDAGYLAIFNRRPDTELAQNATGNLESLAASVRPAIESSLRFREARRLADLDSLTNLHNRRFFHETLAREVSRAQRYGRTLALIVLDVDDFKAVNDRMGHLAGDSVLADVAARVLGVMRASDVACRVGGDEFAVILPESTVDDADQLCRRIQETVSARPFGQAGALSLSAGVAELASGDDAAGLFERADDVLYRAKTSREKPRASSRHRRDEGTRG